MFSNVFFGIYSTCVSLYILSRFLFSLFYRSKPDAGIEPHVAIVMPAFNEQEAIAASLRSLLALRVPAVQAGTSRCQRRLDRRDHSGDAPGRRPSRRSGAA